MVKSHPLLVTHWTLFMVNWSCVGNFIKYIIMATADIYWTAHLAVLQCNYICLLVWWWYLNIFGHKALKSQCQVIANLLVGLVHYCFADITLNCNITIFKLIFSTSWYYIIIQSSNNSTICILNRQWNNHWVKGKWLYSVIVIATYVQAKLSDDLIILWALRKDITFLVFVVTVI